MQRVWRSTAAFYLIGAAALGSAQTADHLRSGDGNARAQEIGAASPLVRAAVKQLAATVALIRDEKLRATTLDGILDRNTCVAHRANLTGEGKHRIVQELAEQHLLNPQDDAKFQGGALAGVFPPVQEDGSACPHVALAFDATPGSDFGSHHSFPGGLAVHEEFNQGSAKNLAAEYRRIYSGGLQNSISEDAVLAAPVWHDWAKMLVLQWKADGTTTAEFEFGGTGSNDKEGTAGNSRTGAHHILSLAETMARGLPPLVVITQASAHSAPTLGNEYKVVNWLRAAAIVARIDPVAKGYLVKDASGKWRLPVLGKGQTPLRIECQINNLSDADFVNSVPAAHQADELLRQAAPEFGYSTENETAYNNQFRNVVLAQLSAERIEMIDASAGLAGVLAEIKKLALAKR